MPDTLFTTNGAVEGHHEAYQITERIAVGPAGIAYRALQSGTNREVLFKLLNPDATHPLDSALVSAIKTSAVAVRQRWIAEWIDAYQDEDGFVLVFDYKKGIAGNFFPAEGRRLSGADGIRLAGQFCEVLETAEKAALPHGDIKPSNIIIWNDPEQGLSLQVLDWGLSICRAQHPEESLHCMSPERLRGGAPTLAGDFFSVGVTLTYLLTGYYPVQGGSPEEIITGWQNFNPESIALVRPDLDDHFCKWLAGLMSFESKNRPASAVHAHDVLKQAVASAKVVPVALATESAPEPAKTASALPVRPVTRPVAKPVATVAKHPTVQLHPQISVQTTQKADNVAVAQVAAANTTTPRKSRVRQGVLTVGIIVTVVAAFCIWVQWRYDVNWKKEITSLWNRVSLPASIPEPVIAETKPVAAVIPPSNKAAPALVKPAAAPAKPVAVIQMRDVLVYPKDTKLDGAKGGTGWPGPWRASNDLVSTLPSRRNLVVAFGGASVSSARREIAAFPVVESSGICFVCSITHSGAEGPTLSLDVLSPTTGSGPAPILVIPKGDKLIVSIPKSNKTVEIASKSPLRLVAQWKFKKQSEGKYECTMTVYLNPVFGKKGGEAPLPALSCVISDFTPPNKLELALASIGISKKNAIISDIRIARTLAEALNK